jgi:RNA polymerase sigma-70 factor, ECF subfamily
MTDRNEDLMETIGSEFQVVYDEYAPRILRYLTNLIGENEAEDLTQEVFVKASKSLDNFRGDSKFSTWLYRIATNTAIDKMRSPSFQQNAEISMSDDLDEIEEQASWTGEETLSSEQYIMKKEMVQCFIDYVKNLPVNYRSIVVLSELEGLTNNEIAEILDLSLNVVKIRLHRGKTKLIQELKSHCKAEDWL